jgi:hypothetical protein
LISLGGINEIILIVYAIVAQLVKKFHPPRPFTNPKVLFYLYKSPSWTPVQGQINPVYTFAPHFF